MSYDYQKEKSAIFTEDGSVMYTSIRDHVLQTLKLSGAIRMQEAMRGAKSGLTWTMMACVDRMVEMGEIVEITPDHVAGQYRVFVGGLRHD